MGAELWTERRVDRTGVVARMFAREFIGGGAAIRDVGGDERLSWRVQAWSNGDSLNRGRLGMSQYKHDQ